VRKITATLLISVFVIIVIPGVVFGQEEKKAKVVSGKINLFGKYDSNADLTSGIETGDPELEEEIESAYISEISAQLLFISPWNSPWRVEFEMFGLTDIYMKNIDDTWFIGRENLYIGYNFGSNTISLQNETSYFSEPDDMEFSVLRNWTTLAFKRVFSPLWQGRIGYENIINIYPESSFFNYYLNGGFLEIRNTWTPLFSTYYSYDFLYYTGSLEANNDDRMTSPESGYRQTGEIGFDSFFAGKNSLSGSYAFQVDDTSVEGIERIGDFDGDELSNEVYAEFNFTKHKGMILYNHKFNKRFSFSMYNELIKKVFIESGHPFSSFQSHRSDLLFLSSTWVSAGIYDGLYGKLRYVYRMNESEKDVEDYQDHIISLGLEYRF